MNMKHVAKSLARKILKPPLHKPDVLRACEILGTAYGGWPVIVDNLGRQSVVYSFGVGKDISFDLAITDRFGCRIEAFDPTPRSLEWVGKQILPAEFHFHPVGVAATNGEVPFYEPTEGSHVSFSDAPASTSSGRSVSAPVKRLSSLVKEIGDNSIDVLKMDIEGFEYVVIEDVLLRSAIRPRQWLIEFHHGMYRKSAEDTRTAVRRLRHAGYRIFHVSETGREYGFVFEPNDTILTCISEETPCSQALAR